MAIAAWIEDLREATSGLWRRRSLAFTTSAVITLGLAIGAATAIASLLYAALLAPLPYRAPERVVHIVETNAARGIDEFSVSAPNFESWRSQATTLSEVSALRFDDVNLAIHGEAKRVTAIQASSNLWQLLGVPLLAGRSFSPTEDGAAAAPIVILGDRLWRSRFHADPDVLGRVVEVQGVQRTIVGVAPEDVGFATGVELWLPLAIEPWLAERRGDRRLTVIGRLVDGVTLEQANTQLRELSARLAAEFTDSNRDWSARIETAHAWVVGPELRRRLMVLAAAVLLILLAACTNIANLQVARATARVRELSVRAALGASRTRLLRALISESAILALMASALGMLTAMTLLGAAEQVFGNSSVRLQQLVLRWDVALLSSAACSATLLLFGAMPALIVMRARGSDALRAGSRSGVKAQRTPLRESLVVVQFALATLLVVAAALLLQQLAALQGASLGFDATRTLVARVAPAPAVIGESEESDQREELRIYQALQKAFLSLPNVTHVALASETPMGQIADTSQNVMSTLAPQGLQSAWRLVSPEYFDAIGLKLLAGRVFRAEGESRQIIVSEDVAQRLYGDAGAALGQQLRFENGREHTVIGVVAAVRQRGLDGAFTPTVYMPTSLFLWPGMTLVVRTNGEIAPLIPAMHEVARRVAPGTPLYDVASLAERVASSTVATRAQAVAVTAFATTAVLFAALGVAGMLAFGVAQRSAELALRMALGASHKRVVGQVMRRGLALGIAGIAIGLFGSQGVRGLIAGSLGDAHSGPGWTVLPVLALLLAVAALASWLPARRATRISPSQALRHE